MLVRNATRLAVIGAAAAALSFAPAALASPPTATTVPADPSGIFDDSAGISGLVSPGGTPTSYAFQYGRTRSYGVTTPVRLAGSGTSDVPVDEALEKLRPDTTYHYRILAFPSAAGQSSAVYGDDESFTTAPRINVQVVHSKVHRDGRRVLVTLRAIGPQDGTAAGKLSLFARWNGRSHWLGKARYRLDVGEAKDFRIRVGKGALAALDQAAGHRLKARAVTRTKGNPNLAHTRLTLVG